MNPNPKTCRIVRPQASYFHKRRRRKVVVPNNYVHVVCDACEYVVALPLRVYGLDGADEVRERHIKTAHFTDQLTGDVVLHEHQLPRGRTA